MIRKSSQLPTVFVATSSADLELAYAIQANLEEDAEIVLWMESFSPGTPTFVSLFETLNACDFAVIALSPDDFGSQKPRLNFLFEIGLFVGALGSERTFLVVPSKSERHFPTDLRGFNFHRYNPNSAKGDLSLATGKACRAIRKQILEQGLYRTWKRLEPVTSSAPATTKKASSSKKISTSAKTKKKVGAADTDRKEVFISYSHKDKRWLEKLRTLLVPSLQNNSMFLWDDSMIKPGDEWEKKIQNALRSAKVAVLLVSPDFLASRFISQHELPPLLDAAKTDGVKILWIYVRASDYKKTAIAEYQAAHDVAKPLRALNNAKQDQELLNIVDKINEAATAR